MTKVSLTEATSWLQSVGITTPQKAGTLARLPSGRAAVIRSLSISKGTSIAALPFTPPCILGFEPWCVPGEGLFGSGGLGGPPAPSRWVTQFLLPAIFYEVIPLRITDVVVHVLQARIEGVVGSRFTNRSREGETYEYNQETGEERNRTKVEGSADLSANFITQMIASQMQEALARVQNIVPTLQSQFQLDVSARFEKAGIWETIKSLVQLLLSGTIETTNGIDATADYVWQGASKSETKHLDMQVSLPVEGNVSYTLQ